MLSSIKLSLVTASLAFGAVTMMPACSSDVTSTSSSSGKLTGTTACGGSTCPAGQYCVQAQTGSCANGCTSDQNCVTGSNCVDIDSVTKTGTCSQVSAPKDCPSFLTKCQACGGGSACTQSFCDKFSASCVSCVAASNCGPSAQATFQSCGCL